ncbi:Halolysin [Tetrabaena socialis]|uniref:Halolysin n=1 Tax=Tetrabaena socialis TaxID=47790 RepID=A0A2J8A845_9CHLO|nr:Halolysin [Tetrabaena socialis]|eukprot:PNH08643.1 Halolysin [Tetrabaena socialis]
MDPRIKLVSSTVSLCTTTADALRSYTDLGHESAALADLVEHAGLVLVDAVRNPDESELSRPGAIAALEALEATIRRCQSLVDNLSKKSTAVKFFAADDALLQKHIKAAAVTGLHKESDGRTALDMASLSGRNYMVVEALLRARADMAAKEKAVHHPWLYWGLLLLLVLGLGCAAIVMPAMYRTVGRMPKPDEQADDPIPLRLMVHLTDANATVKMLLPLLSGFLNASKLPSSGLELLDFDDLGIMREVESRLREQHADILDLMLVDFPVTSKAQLDQISVTIPANVKARTAVKLAATAGFSASDVAASVMATGAAGHNSSQQQSGVADPLEAQQWHLEAIGAASAWAITRGLPDVIVAVVDTGVDMDHPDIRPNLWINRGEIPDNGIDDDGNGSVPVSGLGRSPDRLYSPEFPERCGADPYPLPAPNDDGHGTHVAGLVGTVHGNGLGGSGVAPNVKIMALKAMDNSGVVWTSNVMVAYDYALRMGAHVVSCSFGPRSLNLQPNATELAHAAAEVRLYEEAVQPMAQKGVLLVAAAGNELTDLDQLRNVNMPYLPCTLDLPNVVCVAASNSDSQIYREVRARPQHAVAGQTLGDMGQASLGPRALQNAVQRAAESQLPTAPKPPSAILVRAPLNVRNDWTGSNTGRATVHIAAPGSRIVSTLPGGGATGAYGDKTGSSMATAIVSGAAALVLSVLGASDGNFNRAARARSLLLETGDSHPDLPVISGRTLNVGRAVQAAAELTCKGATLLVPMAVDVAVQSSVLLRGLTDSYFRLPPATAAAIAAAAASDSTVTGPATTNGSVAAVSPVAAGPSSLLGLLPFGGSVRSASTCFSSFKYVGEDVMVAVRGHLKLPEAGQYGVRLATASPLAQLAATVGQRQLVWQAGPGGGHEAVLQVPQPGWYDFELLYANSVQSLELSWALPSSPGTFSSLPDGYLGTGSMTRSTAPAHAPASLPVPDAVPSGFQVLWQPVASAPATFPGSDEEEAAAVDGPTTGSWDGGLLATLDAGRFYPYSSIVEDVSYTSSGALAGALAGGGGNTPAAAAGGALYGLALAHIRAPAASPQLQFRVTCSFCSLYVGDMLVLEVLDPANPAAGSLATRLSSCLTLGPTASTPTPAAPLPPVAGARLATATYPLQLRFATPNASVSVLVLQWAPCNSSLATFAPLTPLLAGGLWCRESASGVNGTTVLAAVTSTPPPPSMQCDAWNSSAVASPLPGKVAVLPRPEEVGPAYSFRLPSPHASSLPCPGPTGTFCPSGANLTFRIADLYPALLRSSEPLYVRCWAWWSSSFRGGLLTVFYSVEAIFGGPTNRQPSAPNTTSLAGGYRQLLALEWHGVKPAARLSVMDGSMDGMLTNATLLVANMFAPAA